MVIEQLNQFIQTNPDPRELKRALAVQMVLKGYKHRQIQEILAVSSGFISKWTNKYRQSGVKSLQLGYIGSVGYLDSQQRQEIIEWLEKKTYCHLPEVQIYIEHHYNVRFCSKQSYYNLLSEAKISWKKTQKTNPKEDPNLVAEKKKEITQWLKSHQQEINKGELVVFYQDECHLLWGDICGYIWGKMGERVENPITNEKQKQTYYGAININNQECLVQAYEKGNSENTIEFIKYLCTKNPESRIALIWDGASYHRSEKLKEYLESINEGKSEEKWRVTCIRFAPNCPRQNPMEDIWLEGKKFIREFYHLCKSFKIVKYLFEFVTHEQIFNFPKLFMYGKFS